MHDVGLVLVRKLLFVTDVGHELLQYEVKIKEE